MSKRSGRLHVPTLVGLDMSPAIAQFLEHQGFETGGRLVDRVRIFAGTEFGGDLGRTVYLGLEPAVLFVGPRGADLPVALAVGRRVGRGENRWFGAGLVDAKEIVQLVAQGLGIGAAR
jgi:hypothetical protein